MRLKEKTCSLVGTISQNRREISDKCKVKKQLYKTEIFRHELKTGIILTSYQCKSKKNVAILSSLHLNVQVSGEGH